MKLQDLINNLDLSAGRELSFSDFGSIAKYLGFTPCESSVDFTTWEKRVGCIYLTPIWPNEKVSSIAVHLFDRVPILVSEHSFGNSEIHYSILNHSLIQHFRSFVDSCANKAGSMKQMVDLKKEMNMGYPVSSPNELQPGQYVLHENQRFKVTRAPKLFDQNDDTTVGLFKDGLEFDVDIAEILIPYLAQL